MSARHILAAPAAMRMRCIQIIVPNHNAGYSVASAAGPPSLASRPTARPVQAVSAEGAALTGTVVHRRPTSHNRRYSRQSFRSATCGDLVVSSSVTNFGTRAFAVASPGSGINCRCTYEHGMSQLVPSRRH